MHLSLIYTLCYIDDTLVTRIDLNDSKTLKTANSLGVKSQKLKFPSDGHQKICKWYIELHQSDCISGYVINNIILTDECYEQ